MDPKDTVQKVVTEIIQNKLHETQDQLLKSLCNNIFIGQWELAKACISSLVKQGNTPRANVIDILLKIIKFPFSQSLGSLTVPTPHHLSWLCLQELKELAYETSDQDDKSVISKLEQDVDFQLTLSLLDKAKDSSTQELYIFFKEHVLKEKVISDGKQKIESDFLSPATVKLLQKTMLTCPSLGNSVLTGLCVEEESTENRYNERLHGISIECMNTLLDEAEERLRSGSTQDEVDSLLRKTLEILSFYNPSPYWNYIQIRQLFTRLLTMTTKGISQVLTVESIVSVLSGRSSVYLLDEFCKIFHEVWLLSTCNKQREKHSALTVDQQANLGLLIGLDRSLCWRDFFISCHKKSVHFLAEILDLCLALINAGKFMELQDLLSFPEFHPLKPAVLLMGWSQCVTSAHARTLIDTLWDELCDWPNQSMTSSCRSLAYHLDLMQWCMDRAKPLLEGSELNPGRQATQLLQGLETHSVLYMLHHSTSLAQLDHSEVLQLLNNLSVDKKAKSKKKAVKFNDDSSSKSPIEPINVEQQKDITIFRSFCAIKNVMDALTFCVSKADQELLNPVQIKSMVSGRRLCKTFLSYQSLSSSEGDESSSPDLSSPTTEANKTKSEIKENSEQFFASYDEMVTKKLRNTREHLSLIQPMAYRLEVMEDIFSLLFVTSADLNTDGSAIDMETDDENDSKQSSLDNIGGDSLNISCVSEEDGPNVGDSLPDKGKTEASTPSTGQISNTQSSPNAGLEYDVPFVDSHQHAADSIPTPESAKSAYFTLGDENQGEPEATARHISPTRLPRRRKKRVTSETQANDIVGFLANEYLSRDILNLLRDALNDFNTARSSLSGKALENRRDITGASRAKPSAVDPLIEEALQANIVTSVQPASLPKRLTKLTQAVHEAWWRLQLVAHEAFPRMPGQLLSEPVYITDSEINFLPACERWTCSAETGSGQMFNSWQVTAPPHEAPESNIITRMMASPESLLVLSLIKGNIAQAADVIKLFRLTDKVSETREVGFADCYNSSAEKICNLEVQSREQSQTPPKVGKRSLKALSKAAAVGVATASLSHIVEDLISSPNVPPVPKPRSAAGREKCSHLFNLDPPSALLLDLLCTSCHTWEASANMLDIIKSKTRLLQQDPRMGKHARSASEIYAKKSAVLSSSTTSSLSPQSPQSSISSSAASPSSASSSIPLGSTAAAPPRNVDSVLNNITGCSKLAWRLHDLILIDDGLEGVPSHQGRRSHRVGLQSHLHRAQTILYPEMQVKLDSALAIIRRAVDQVMQVLAGPKNGATVDINVDESVLSISPTSSLSGGGSFSGSKLSNASTVSRASSAKQVQERHPLHGAVKFLMFSMEKYIPGDGLAHAHLSRSGILATPPSKNFLLSLYEHVKEMAYLVAECEGSTKDLTNNYFKVLDDGPVNVLGRLLFVKKMPPAKLESVAENLSLNLTHIIVYSCCPKIPSKHPQRLPQPKPKFVVKKGGTSVMNAAPLCSESSAQIARMDSQPEAMHHPEVQVRTILSQTITSMQGNAKGVFDMKSAVGFLKTSEYQATVMAVQSLEQLDLDLLETENERICFLVNLTNLMILHCNLAHIQHRLESSPQLGESEMKDKEQVKLCPLAAADHLGYFCTFSYHVGQLGLVSVFDLLTILCREGLTPSSRWRKLMDCRKIDLSPHDPWKKYCVQGESRLIFVINHGCISSPPLQVLKPDTVQVQLSQALKSYVSHTVSVSLEQERVALPELLVWHESDFVQHDPTPTETPHAALLKWVAQYVGSEKHVQLQRLLGLDTDTETNSASGKNELAFRIAIDSFDNKFAVAFNISQVKPGGAAALADPALAKSGASSHTSGGHQKDQSSQQSSTRTVPTPPSSGKLSNQLSDCLGASPSWSLAQPVYNLTPVTLEYVKQDSLLVATMVSLVCADNLDNIEQQFTDDHFQLTESNSTSASQSLSLSRSYSANLPLPHSSSDISLVDIRSYRYHRLTDDYPIMMRHLLHYILPLASANNPQLLEGRDPILKFVTNDIDDQVKLCMFSLPGSRQFQGVVHDMANCLLEERKWLELLQILQSLPQQVMEEQLCLQALQDHVLSSWALSEVKQPGFAPKIGDKLRSFYNTNLLARTVLSISTALSKDLCLDLLELCLTKLEQNAVIRTAVAARYEEVQIHGKIARNARALRRKLSNRDVFTSNMSSEDKELSGSLEEVADWRQIPNITETRPMDIITLLEKSGDFQTAKEWATLHNMSPAYQSEIKKRQVIYLLREGGQPETVKAFQELDTLRAESEQDCLTVCKDVMEGLSNPQQIKFILSFMLQYLAQCLPADDLENLRLQRIGAKALMCIPAKLQKDYNHLMSSPHLILEQLLMNMKADLAGKIFEQIKADFLEIKEPKLRMAQDQFNNLLAKYANKAIEVTVVAVQETRSRRGSICSTADLEASMVSNLRRSSEIMSPSVPYSMAGRADSSNRRSTGQRPGMGKEQTGKFIMPANPPSVQDWVPDSATSVCMVCQIEQFSMFNRRHHCRRCGRVVCASCSTKESMVFGRMARTCDECYEQIHCSGPNKAQEEHEIYSQRIKDSLSGSSPSIKSGLSPTTSITNLAQNQLRSSIEAAIHQVDHTWKLSTDMALCDQVRAEFYFEQAPSVSLCVSMLKQHSSRTESGKLILSICDKLSSYMVPISPGVPNPEIDYSLIISVIRQLLFQAKIGFQNMGDSGMVDQCDVYLARVDLLRVMVGANFQDLPTIRELTKMDSVRRLRDKLIADERLSLAMEVSTKCGIDPAGVWSAMGFACLQLGDFAGARDKFSHCLKAPNDKNQTSAGQSRLLKEILDFLDTIPNSGTTEVERLLRDPESICNIKTLLVPSVGEENRIESVPHKECIYYLRTYGTYMDHIVFLRQHNYWMKAVQFAINHHCSSDVFVTGLMVPAMNSGEMGRLLEQMLMLDPTLEKWTPYLSATCKHLLKNKYFYTLYQVQIFMKDYIRAAMTCISHFYQRGATSYLDLSGRLQYLLTAQQHLQSYLDPGQWGSVRHPLSPVTPTTPSSPGRAQAPSWDRPSAEAAARMVLTPEQVKKHIGTIALQIEVTKFMEVCITQALGGASADTCSSLTSSKSKVPTLFGQGSDRTQLVGLILLSGSDFSAGYDLTVRIIKLFRLNPVLIFSHCSRELAKLGRSPEISTLIQRLVQENLVDDDGVDEIVGASLLVMADSQNQARDESDALIQLLRKDGNKINAFILVGKLRSAYLLAVKRERVEDVQMIAGAAQRLKQSAVTNICKKWLEQHKKQ